MNTNQPKTQQQHQPGSTINPLDDRLIKLESVLARVNMSHPKLYALISAGKFPDAVEVPNTGPKMQRKTLWRLSDVVNWIQGLPFKGQLEK
tara:strand:+ start:250 stop:522 length:273 start_codon:yes stop_codon:yes gene_type:complete